MDEMLNKIADRLDDLAFELEEKIDQSNVREKVEETKENAVNFVKKYPYPSIGAGFVLGFIIGKLLTSDD